MPSETPLPCYKTCTCKLSRFIFVQGFLEELFSINAFLFTDSDDTKCQYSYSKCGCNNKTRHILLFKQNILFCVLYHFHCSPTPPPFHVQNSLILSPFPLPSTPYPQHHLHSYPSTIPCKKFLNPTTIPCPKSLTISPFPPPPPPPLHICTTLSQQKQVDCLRIDIPEDTYFVFDGMSM